MRKTVMILDGYNVIHRVPALRTRLTDGLEAARSALIQYCTEWMDRRRDVWLFFVVFDGDSATHCQEMGGAPGVRQVFTKTGESADDRIIHIVEERESFSRCVVVSDDLYVTRGAKGTATEIMTAAQFFAVLREDGRGDEGKGTPAPADKSGITPAQAKAIHDELMRTWVLK
jgi:predicted RNA-binding protein with PIN domain